MQVKREIRGSSSKAGSAQGAIAAVLLSLVACGGGSSNAALTLSGTVSGLTSSGLALTTNGVNLDVSAGATTFTFGPVLSDGMVYNVTVPIQPSGQVCTVTNGTGTAATANISNVVVTCSDRTFTVGGTISGLAAPGLVLADGSDTLSVPEGATSFTLPTGVAYGSTYTVTVATQPAGLTCNVTNGTGTVAAEAVTNITVSCTDKPLTVGGTISGLGSASGLLLVNGSDRYAAPAGATSFTLESPLSPGTPYAVHVQSQPAGKTCSASNGPGTMPTHDVTDVSIVCSEEAYGLGGTVAGLAATGLVLSDGDNDYHVPAQATDFLMPEAVAHGSRYSVRVKAQPAGLTCTVSDGSGTMPARPVTEISVTCSPTSYTVGGSISGLTTSGLVLTDGTETLSVSANAGQFSMPSGFADGSAYAVTIQAQPSDATCEVADGTGTVSAEVGTVRVSCAARTPAP